MSFCPSSMVVVVARDRSGQATHDARRDGRDDGRGSSSLGAGWRLLWVLLAVVAAVGVGYLVGSSDTTTTVGGVVSNAGDSSALQDEKEALTSVDSSTSRAWQAYTDRLNGLAEQGTRVAASGHDGAAVADAANALRQDQ